MTLRFVNGQLDPNGIQVREQFEKSTGAINKKQTYSMKNGQLTSVEVIEYQNGKPIRITDKEVTLDESGYPMEKSVATSQFLADGSQVDHQTLRCTFRGKPCNGFKVIPSANPGATTGNYVVKGTYVNGELKGTVNYTYYRSDNQTVKSRKTVQF